MNAFTKPRRAVLYARLSVAAEESVSVERQLEACRKYCEARGIEVVGFYVDDGVSATKNRPEDRDGWKEVLNLDIKYDVVVVWKVDRLARRVLDFLHADEALQERGAALMAVEDPIDMTTAQGRAFATMLAVFGEMEAAAISARVKAARQHLVVKAGRVAGGMRPWPFDLAPNPDGPGFVLAPNPIKAKAIRDAADDLINNRANCSEIARRWDAMGLKPKHKPKDGEPERTWHPVSVANVLRNPTLYGAYIYHGKPVRNEDYSVKIGPHAILDYPTWRSLQPAITHPSRGKPIVNYAMLQGIAVCGSCGKVMGCHRPSTRGQANWKYTCRNRDCANKVAISMQRLEEYVGQHFLDRYGHIESAKVVAPPKADPKVLAELEARLLDIQDSIDTTDDDDEAMKLFRLRKNVRADIVALREDDGPSHLPAPGVTIAERFLPGDKDKRRNIMVTTADPVVTIAPGTPHRKGLDTSRIKVEYKRPALPVGKRVIAHAKVDSPRYVRAAQM